MMRTMTEIAEIEEYFNSFPAGYKFDPTDEELIIEYLLPKIERREKHVNLMHDVNIYKHNPDDLAEKYCPQGNKGWYFFTSREKKYPKGKRPNRKAGDGFWKATGADKAILRGDIEVGSRRALVFYKGKPPKGQKTPWIMHEFRAAGPSQMHDEFQAAQDAGPSQMHEFQAATQDAGTSQVKKRKLYSINNGDACETSNMRNDGDASETNGMTNDGAAGDTKDMRLDEFILCRIYKKNELPPKGKSPRGQNEGFELPVDEMIEGESPSKESPVIDDINQDGNMYNTSNHPCQNVDVYMVDNNGIPNFNTYGASNNNGNHNVNVYTTGYNYGDYTSVVQPLIGSISTNQLMTNASISGMNVNASTSYSELFDWDPYQTQGNYSFSEDLNGDYNNEHEHSMLNFLFEPQIPTMADPDPNPMGMISSSHEAINMSNSPLHLTEEIEVKDVLPLLAPPPQHTALCSFPG